MAYRLRNPHRRGQRALALAGAALIGLMTVSLAAPNAMAAPARTDTPAAGQGTTSGLRADYYTITDTSAFALAEANRTATVLDKGVNVDDMLPVWKALTGRTENTGVSWTGFVTAPATGDYTFSAIGDNGFRLWVGGQSDADRLIDFWVDQWDVEKVATRSIHLDAGQPVPFRFDLFQHTGGSYIHVRWQSENAGIAKQNIPDAAFTPPTDFHPIDVKASVPAAGDSVVLTFPGAVAGTSELASHVRVPVDGSNYPIAGIQPGPGADQITISVAATILKGTLVRVAYDGDGSLTLDGAAAGAFNAAVDNGATASLETTWAGKVDPRHPLPEYPRPQLTRPLWQNLNGQWDFVAQPATDSPIPTSWSGAETAVVPYPIESKLSGIQRHEDHVAYHRTFAVPAAWHVGTGAGQQRLILQFGAVDYQSTVYVNGTVVARHTGGYDAFSADITSALKTGANDLVVQVTDTTGNQARGKQSANPSGIFYTPSSGIWQTVWIEPVPAAHVDSLALTPVLSSRGDSVTVTVNATGTSPGAHVRVQARDASGSLVGTVAGKPGEALSLRIPYAHRWTPDDPYLYDLTAVLADGPSLDSVGSYAGIRAIGIKNIDGVNRIVLNGEQTFLLSTLDQGFWPDGIYTAPTGQALAWDIQQTKKLGFNTIRKHIKVEPARWYYDADRSGIMVWQDMPSGSNTTADQRTQWQSELQRLIAQHISTTSIIGWIPFNEGWGQWGIPQAAQVAAAIKAQDPSRLVDTRSGLNCCDVPGDTNSGDIIDWHQYTGPATPTPDATRAAIDGEHGGFSLTVIGHSWPGGSVNPYGEVQTSKQLTDDYVANTAELVGLARQQLSGSVYTQLTDVEGEHNGFYTYDRRVLKMDAARVRAANRAVLAAGSGKPVAPGTPGLGGIAWWRFDTVAGDQSPDADARGSNPGSPATLSGGATLVPGKDGNAVAFDGQRAQATATVPRLDTTGSYSVSAWVRLDTLPTGFETAVATDGLGGSSPFFLQYVGSGTAQHGFAFSVLNSPRAVATGIAPQPGQWYHLVGVRDAAAGIVALYVNGALQATAYSYATDASTGTVTVGRAQWQGNPTDFLKGAVDDVRVYDRALSEADVAALAGVVPDGGRVAAWTGAAQHLGGPYTDKTVREIVHPSIGGTAVELRLSNTFGTVPVTFDSVYAGQRGTDASVAAGTNQRVTFGGSASVTVPAGAEVVSDPVDLLVQKGRDLTVSIHVAGNTGEVTGHTTALQTTYYGDGDRAAQESGAGYVDQISSWFWLDAVTVVPARRASTVVAIGDSITDGYDSTPNANHRWPNYLADRLPAGSGISVVDEGISGNEVTADGAGASALSRLDRDAVTLPGTRTIVLMAGVNDIGNGVVTDPDQLITAYEQIVARAHAAGEKVVGGTITPFEGAGYYSGAKGQVWQAVNDWIRTSGEFDAVVDFAHATQDPADPNRLLPAYDSGDHLHPNDAGYQAMAGAVSLSGL